MCNKDIESSFTAQFVIYSVQCSFVNLIVHKLCEIFCKLFWWPNIFFPNINLLIAWQEYCIVSWPGKGHHSVPLPDYHINWGWKQPPRQAFPHIVCIYDRSIGGDIGGDKWFWGFGKCWISRMAMCYFTTDVIGTWAGL